MYTRELVKCFNVILTRSLVIALGLSFRNSYIILSILPFKYSNKTLYFPSER